MNTLFGNDKVIRFTNHLGEDTIIKKSEIIKANIKQNGDIYIYTKFSYPKYFVILKKEYTTIAQALEDIFG